MAGWLFLSHVYTSHMTGNTASAASNIVRGQIELAARYAWPIIPFIACVLYSASVTILAKRRGINHSFAVALATELVLLAAFILVGFAERGTAKGPLHLTSHFMLCTPFHRPLTFNSSYGRTRSDLLARNLSVRWN